jgi:hypothetical protein
MSPNRTVSFPWPAVPSCTFKLSTTSGLSLPPPRSWLRSWVSFSIALRICASRLETSYASSVGVGSPGFFTGGEESVCAWALLALPAFLHSEWLTEKLREALKRH